MKGKRILVLTDSTQPNLTMNGVIATNIVEELEKDNSIIRVSLNRGGKESEDNVIFINGFPSQEALLEKRIANEKKPLIKAIYTVALNGIKLTSLLSRIKGYAALNQNLIESFRIEIMKIMSSQHIDYLLCVCIPFEAAVAAVETTKYNLNTIYIMYQIDDFVEANDRNYPIFLWKKRIRERIKVLKNFQEGFNRYFALKSVYEKEKGFYGQDNVNPIGLPLIKNEVHKKRNRRNYFRLAYTGSLVKGVRQPDDVIDILKEVGKIVDIVFDIYHRGNCGSVIDKSIRNAEYIINHGAVDAKSAYNAMMDCDMLVCISTFDGDQISGKTFDYISTGKPIIFFYYNEIDSNLMVFRKYRLFLGVNLNRRRDENIKLISDFIKKDGNKEIAFDEIEGCYYDYSPAYVTKKLFGE